MKEALANAPYDKVMWVHPKYYNVHCPMCLGEMDVRQYPEHERVLCLEKGERPPWMFSPPVCHEENVDYEK